MKKATFDQALQLLQLFKDQGKSLDDLQQLFDSGVLSSLFKAKPTKIRKFLLNWALGLSDGLIHVPGKIQVNYCTSLDELAKVPHGGNSIVGKEFLEFLSSFDVLHYKNKDIVDTNFILMDFGKNMSRDEVEKEMSCQGVRSASVVEAFHFRNSFSISRENCIIISVYTHDKVKTKRYLYFCEDWCSIGYVGIRSGIEEIFQSFKKTTFLTVPIY